MGLIAGIGRWRHHHAVTEEEVGMAAPEAATALRAALPLVRVPQHADKRLQLCVDGEDEALGRDGERVWAEVATDGVVDSCGNPGASVDASGQGETAAWVSMLLDGDPQRLQIEGDVGLVGHALTGLYEVLWTPTPL
jgi:hypothetical protein